jgi:hypothetical protein
MEIVKAYTSSRDKAIENHVHPLPTREKDKRK